MRSLDNDRGNLIMEDLEQSGRYDQQLLEELKNGDFMGLNLLSENDKNRRDFMEPLLYAVKNAKNTYKIYKYYGEILQRDILRDNKELAVDIVMTEPELIAGTPISGNAQFILENVQNNPKIIRYMDPNLQTNNQFISELSNKNNSEIISEIARIGLVAEVLNNPELSSDKEFMSNAIRKDVTFLEYASETLRNDGEFLKNEASQNEDVVNYVADNADKFGLEGIEGVRESSSEYILSNKEYSDIIDNKAKEENRYRNAKDKIEEHTSNGKKGTATLITAAVVAQGDNVSEEFITRTLNYAILTMDAVKKDLDNGKMKLDKESRQQRQLIPPVLLDKLSKKLQEQGINLGQEFEQKMESYRDSYSDYMGQVKEHNKQNASNKKSTVSLGEVQGITENEAVPEQLMVGRPERKQPQEIQI